MTLSGLGPAEAGALLDRHDGQLAAALATDTAVFPVAWDATRSVIGGSKAWGDFRRNIQRQFKKGSRWIETVGRSSTHCRPITQGSRRGTEDHRPNCGNTIWAQGSRRASGRFQAGCFE